MITLDAAVGKVPTMHTRHRRHTEAAASRGVVPRRRLVRHQKVAKQLDCQLRSATRVGPAERRSTCQKIHTGLPERPSFWAPFLHGQHV